MPGVNPLKKVVCKNPVDNCIIQDILNVLKLKKLQVIAIQPINWSLIESSRVACKYFYV